MRELLMWQGAQNMGLIVGGRRMEERGRVGRENEIDAGSNLPSSSPPSLGRA